MRGTAISRGFTLLELLVVMGIMSMLGIAATGGYHAMVRGMTERGAVASASAVLRAAKERAQVDRKHIAVFCYNRLLKAPNPSADEPGVVAGVMTAVRRVGRISAVRGDFLYDEFGDLAITYETEEEESLLRRRKGLRLFKLEGAATAMRYSVVADATFVDDSQIVYLPSTGLQTNIVTAAFYNLKRSDHEPSAWKAGDVYGFEFLDIQLPIGFVFGGSIPSEVGRIDVSRVIDFDPDQDVNETEEIYSTKPDANGMPQRWKKAGTASSDDKSV